MRQAQSGCRFIHATSGAPANNWSTYFLVWEAIITPKTLKLGVLVNWSESVSNAIRSLAELFLKYKLNFWLCGNNLCAAVETKSTSIGTDLKLDLTLSQCSSRNTPEITYTHESAYYIAAHESTGLVITEADNRWSSDVFQILLFAKNRAVALAMSVRSRSVVDTVAITGSSPKCTTAADLITSAIVDIVTGNSWIWPLIRHAIESKRSRRWTIN